MPRTTYAYTNYGQIQTVTDAEGRVTQIGYDPSALENVVRTTVDYGTGSGHLNVITSYAYDPYGNVTSVTDPNGNTTTKTYDTLRRVTQANGAIAGVVSTFTYDSEGRLLTSNNATGNSGAPWQTTTITYTPNGKKRTVTDNAGYVTGFTYDGADRLATTTDPVSRIRAYAYDNVDRLLTVTDTTVGGTGAVLETYTYTPDSLTNTFADARSFTTSYAYDGFNRLLTQTYPDSSTVSAGYDADGNVVTRTVPSGGTIGYTYDALNRVATKTPSGEAAGTIAYGYDLTGRLLTASDASSSNAYTFSYDTAGRQITRTDQNSYTWSRTYDSAGNLLTQGYPNASYVTYRHDAMNRVTEIDFAGSTAQPIAKYQWDLLSRRTLLTYGDNSTAAYSYTSNNDLSALTHILSGSNSVAVAYSYNGAHQRIGESTSNGSYAYIPGTGTTSYGTASTINTYPTIGSVTLSYDANHNLIFDGANTLGYDVENRLISAQNASAVTGAYLYDPLGARKQSTVGSSTTKFFEDGGQEIAEFTGSTANTLIFVRGPGNELVASLSGATPGYTPTYYHNNPQGSPLAVTYNGAVSNTYSYGPFGETNPLAGPAFRYTGQRLDAETGLYYYRARHYSPTLGRFLQMDPAGYAGGLNLYAYTGNDPVNNVDPSGLLGFGVIAGGSAEAGVPYVSAGAQDTAGVGMFMNFNPLSPGYLSSSAGLFTSTGLAETHGNMGLNTNSLPPTPAGQANSVLGAFAGVGVGGFVTNASSLSDLEGMSRTITLNLPVGSLQLSYGGGTFSLSASVGPGIGANLSSYYTSTSTSTLNTSNLEPPKFK